MRVWLNGNALNKVFFFIYLLDSCCKLLDLMLPCRPKLPNSNVSHLNRVCGLSLPLMEIE